MFSPTGRGWKARKGPEDSAAHNGGIVMVLSGIHAFGGLRRVSSSHVVSRMMCTLSPSWMSASLTADAGTSRYIDPPRLTALVVKNVLM